MTTSTPAKTHHSPPKKRRAAKPAHKGGHPKKVPPPRKSFSSRPTAPERPEALIQHVVEVDEARERLGGSAEVFARATPAPTDNLADNATGANDAASELREPLTPDETGGPFLETSGDTEFFSGSDPPLAPDARQEPSAKRSSADADAEPD